VASKPSTSGTGVAKTKSLGKPSLFSAKSNPTSKQLAERRQGQLASLPSSKRTAATSQLKKNLAERDAARTPSGMAKKSGKTPGKIAQFNKSKAPAGDMARKKVADRQKALKGDKRTADLASRRSQMLTGKDRDALKKVLHDPKSPPAVKKAARDALREDAALKKAMNGAFGHHGLHHPGHDWDPWRHHHPPFDYGGLIVTPIDFYGLFDGIATLISVAVGGGGVVELPPPMMDDGYAIFDPVGDVAPDAINATNFGSYRGVYYGVDDPVDPYAADAGVPPVRTSGRSVRRGETPPADDMDYTEEGTVGPTSVAYHARHLLIGNASKEKVTVHVQYLTQDENGNWVWLPGDPENATESVTFELEPDQYGDAFDGDWRIQAARVRIWAESESGQKWEKHKDSDFLLVPEVDAEGIPTYMAPEMGTVKWIVK